MNRQLLSLSMIVFDLLVQVIKTPADLTARACVPIVAPITLTPYP